jgi:lysophospholipase L1-like esterase
MPRKILVGGAALFTACTGGVPSIIASPITINPALFSTVALTASEKTVTQNSILTAAVVHRETVIPTRNVVTLLREASSISVVENVTTGVVYPPSSYSVVAGKLHVNNTIPMLPAAWLNTKVAGSAYEAQSYRKDGTELRLEFDYFQNQIEVTYEAAAPLQHLSKISSLPKMTKLMAAQAQVAITFVGDSITVGGDSSELLGVAPNQKPWAKLVAGYLTDKNPQVRYRNVAMGGMTAAFGANPAQTDLAQKTDVLVVAYGMNDQSETMPKATFKAHYRTMMDRAKAQNPNVEFLLVVGFRPELTWQYSHAEYMDLYRDAVIELAAEYTLAGNHTVYVDVMAEFDRMLQRKLFGDICSNGVNHPNDFGHVLYAQTILHRLGFLP